MSNPNVYAYSEAKEFLSAVLEAKKKENPRYSLRAWSRQLGFKTPSFLSEVIRGERKFKPTFAEKVADQLKLDAKEKTYLVYLALFQNAKTTAEKEIYLKKMNCFRENLKIHDVDLDVFRSVSDWHHLALVEMVTLNDFKEDPAYLSRRLAKKVAESQIQSAIDRLERLKFLQRDENGRLEKTEECFHFGQQIPSEAIREHHIQTIDLAKKALEEQSVDEREFSGSTIPIKKEDIPKFKKLIFRFHKEVHKLMDEENGEDVYRANVQFFKLTKSQEEESRNEN